MNTRKRNVNPFNNQSNFTNDYSNGNPNDQNKFINYQQGDGNPFNQFGNMTPQMWQTMQNNQPSNFNQSFMQNTPMIEKTDFRNKNNVLHNNLADNLFAERIVEYNIHVNSADRDIQMFPNQFQFSVSFGGAYAPYITRGFKNIKYVKIVEVLLPKIGKVVTNGSDPAEFSSDPNDRLDNDRYLVLRINELSNNKFLSTGKVLTDSSVYIYNDKCYGRHCISWLTDQPPFSYNHATLGNVKSKLTFSLCDSSGNKLKFQGLNTIAPITDLSNPLHKSTQMEIILILGVIENEQNVDTQFET
jgi:hypothetical protein